MKKKISSEERAKILKSCEKLLYIRFQYAHLALIYSYENIGRMDIVASAEHLQSIIDDAIVAAKHYLNTGEDFEQIQKITEETRACSLSLLKLVQQLDRNDIAPIGIHPDDWEWIESVKANDRSI